MVNLDQSKQKRERFAIIVVLTIFIIVTAVQIRLGGLSQELPITSSIVFFGIINLNVILLTLLIFLIARSLTKVFLERKRKKSKLQTKLVLGFLGFGIIPTVILFIIAAVYINSSFDKWFSIRVANTLQTSLDLSKSFYSKITDDLVHFSKNFQNTAKLDKQYEEYNISYASSLNDPFELPIVFGQEKYFYMPSVEDYRELLKHKTITHTLNSYDADSFQLMKLLPSGEILFLGQVLASPESNRLSKITNTLLDYERVNPLKYPIKSIYLVLLLTMTLMIIFVSIWVGLYLSRQWTNPLSQLIHGIRFVSEGHYDIRIPNFAKDEIGLVIDTFNNMANNIAENEHQKQKQQETLEMIINSINSVIIVFSEDKNIFIKNKSVNFNLTTRMKDYLLGSVVSKDLHQIPDLFGVWDIHKVNLPENKTLIAMEDRSDDLKQQRELAWREVARRIAHEIKNPLTPIKLTAERLFRNYGNSFTGKDRQQFEESTRVITEQVDLLKNLVNEFSQFAKLPSPVFKNHDIVEVVSSLQSLYKQSYPKIWFGLKMDENIPDFPFDLDGIKRVIINILENAKDAIKDKKDASILFRIFYNESISRVRLEFEDNGEGIKPEEIKRVFEPYFSTKPTGSGLGLAIAHRIALDHQGRLSVFSDGKFKTVFSLELPTNLRESEEPCLESSLSKTIKPSELV